MRPSSSRPAKQRPRLSLAYGSLCSDLRASHCEHPDAAQGGGGATHVHFVPSAVAGLAAGICHF